MPSHRTNNNTIYTQQQQQQQHEKIAKSYSEFESGTTTGDHGFLVDER